MRDSDNGAFLYHEIGQRLIQRLNLLKFQPETVLDVGCRTGIITALLLKHYPKARVMGCERTIADVIAARKRAPWLRTLHGVVAAPESLPFAAASCDLVFSHLAMPWCEDVERVLQTFYRVLKPEGALLFSALGPETDTVELWPEIQPALFDIQDIGDALLRVGFVNPVMDVDRITLTRTDAAPIHCEVIYGHAWGVGTTTTTAAVFPLAQLTRSSGKPLV